MPKKQNPLAERWASTGDDLLRLDPEEFRRLLELGEAIIKWYRARTDVEPRRQHLLKSQSELN